MADAARWAETIGVPAETPVAEQPAAADTVSSPVEASGKRICLLQLQPDVGPRNFAAFAVLSLTSIMMLVYANAALGFALTEFYAVRTEDLGRVSGGIVLADEIYSIVTLGLFGLLTDRFGSRIISAMGYVLIALGLGLVPVGGGLGAMFVWRLIFASGVSMVAPQLTALVAEYVSEEHLGRATGLQGTLVGLGAVVAVFVLLRLPAVLCLRLAYWVSALVALLVTVVMALGLRRRPGGAEPTLREMLARGWRLARSDAEVPMAFACGFLARCQTTVVTVFISAWVNANYLERGLCGNMRPDDFAETVCSESLLNDEKTACREGFSRASLLSGVMQTLALCAAPFVGILSERSSPVTAATWAAGAGAVAYAAMVPLGSPDGAAPVVIASLVGCAQIASIVTSTRFIAAKTPEDARGTMAGCFSLCGALGVLAAGSLGGILFDVVGHTSPFGVVAVLDLVLVAVLLWWGRFKHQRR